MSPSSSEFEMEFNSEEITEQHSIHEYSFGIISSDNKGIATIVSISEPYKKRLSSESSEDNDIKSSEGFHSWSMSMYQRPSSHTEESDVLDENDNNNNLTTVEVVGSAPATGSFLRDYQRHSLKAFGNFTGDDRIRVHQVKPKPLLTRTWSSSSGFGGVKTQSRSSRVLTPTKSRSIDPEDTDLELAAPVPAERWFSSITQIPDRIRQLRADKNRFNVKNVPREQLKQLHCY